MTTSKSNSAQFSTQKSSSAGPVNSNVTKDSSIQPGEQNRKANCTKCRKAIQRIESETPGRSPTSNKSCRKCRKIISSKCPSKASLKSFQAQASSWSIKSNGSRALIKCTTALKEKLSSKDQLDDYLLLDGPVYIRKKCLDVTGGTCRGTCCSSGEEIGEEVEITGLETDEEINKQRCQECLECCHEEKCGEKKICDDNTNDIIANYEKLYLQAQSYSEEPKEIEEKAMYDPFAMYISAFSKTHGETPGDGKYHFLMNDAACSAPSDDPDDNNIIVATSSRPQSPVCIVSQDTTCTADTISEKSTHDSQSTPTSDDVSDASILIGTLDADQEEAEQKEDEAEEKGADDEKGVGEEGKIESEGEDNKEGERRNSKVSWGGYDDAATVDIVLSEEDHNDNLSHVQISESTNRSSDAWRYSTVERARPGKKSTSFVKKSLINGHLESPPPPPPTKRKWCGFFRRNKNKPDRKLKATKSKSETFDNDLDSTESSEISLDESRRDSMKSL